MEQPTLRPSSKPTIPPSQVTPAILPDPELYRGAHGTYYRVDRDWTGSQIRVLCAVTGAWDLMAEISLDACFGEALERGVDQEKVLTERTQATLNAFRRLA